MTLSDFFAAQPAVWVVGCLVLGLLVGSFLNVVIYRLPKMMESSWQTECRVVLGLDQPGTKPPAAFNLAFPQSHCPHCNTAIKPWQNIPLLSYALLRGRCGHCATPISPRYPIIEL